MSNRQRGLILNLTEGRLFRSLLSFSLPLMVSTLLQMSYTLVDMFAVGRYAGSVGLSAVSTGGDILHLCTALCTGFSHACQVMVSQSIGRGDTKSVGRIAGAMATATCIFSLLMGITGFLLCKPLLHLLNIPQEAFADAVQYVWISCGGIFFIFGYNAVSAILRGMGNSRLPLLFVFISTVLNIGLDFLLVGPLHMGAGGAALATVISQGISFLLSVVYLYRRRGDFHFAGEKLGTYTHLPTLKNLTSLGIPMALQLAAVFISTLFVSSFTNRYGVIPAAATGLGNKVSAVVSIVTTGLAQGGATVVGQCIGARKYRRIYQTFRLIFFLGLVFALPLSLLILRFPERVFGLFVSGEELALIARAYAPISALTILAYAFRAPCVAFVNGIGKARLSLTVGLIESTVFRIAIPFFLGIVLSMELSGFWLGTAIASYSYVLVSLPYFLFGGWKKTGGTPS